jgi:uncharacterized protein
MEAAKKENMAEKENVQSILGKIKSVVSGKEKVTIDDEKPVTSVEDEEPMELTDVVEAGQVEPAVSSGEAQAAEPSTAKADEENFVDILKEIDSALEKQYKEGVQPEAGAEAVAIEQPSVVEEVVEQPAENANLAQALEQNEPEPVVEVKKQFASADSQNIMANQVEKTMAENKPNILSEEIADKSSKAIQNLLNNIPRPDISSPAFRSATTVEDVVVEMMKPMLKEWLDKNLEAIVRDIVDKEIKKIIPRD